MLIDSTLRLSARVRSRKRADRSALEAIGLGVRSGRNASTSAARSTPRPTSQFSRCLGDMQSCSWPWLDDRSLSLALHLYPNFKRAAGVARSGSSPFIRSVRDAVGRGQHSVRMEATCVHRAGPFVIFHGERHAWRKAGRSRLAPGPHDRHWPRLVCAKRKRVRCPVVLEGEEVAAVLSRLRWRQRVIACRQYGFELRLVESLRLRVGSTHRACAAERAVRMASSRSLAPLGGGDITASPRRGVARVIPCELPSSCLRLAPQRV